MDDESLGWAVFDGDTAGLRGMLLSGADPNVVDDGTPLVELAVRFGRIGVLRVLVEFGGTLDVPSLLHNVVAGRELPDMLLVLLELGADVNARDSAGWMPLHFASAYGYEGSARALLDAGADITAITREGLTAAEIAQRNGHGTLASLLVHRASYPVVPPQTEPPT
ncbi:ankyrin repeat domain-containing protein [Herbidospora galbida]|uniref:ankyrin repeat domain-containing protein n=1 Tax=Herbidospora galbida TaxID=2575442 RepID=UPI00148570DD|nr:ankyrin repeat domain-containing protein [Herbidospora galbida]